MEMQNDIKWYQRSWGIIALLALFFPVGLFLMWKFAKWHGKVKWAVTSLFALLILAGAFSGNSGNKTVFSTASQTQTSNVDSTSSMPTAEPTKPVEKMNVVVTSQMVKKVDKKYRYFFDIRNYDIKGFEGSVTISLYNEKLKNPLAGDTFITKRSIEPELGTSVYLDANTGPTSVHGEFGLTKFKYVVKVSDVEVNNGGGELTDKFEDTDTYGF